MHVRLAALCLLALAAAPLAEAQSAAFGSMPRSAAPGGAASDTAEAPSAEAVRAALDAALDELAAHDAEATRDLRALYAGALLWPDHALDAFLLTAVADGLSPALAARPVGTDARALAGRDIATTRAVLALARAWSGTRADPAELYPGRWFAPRRTADPVGLVRRAADADAPGEAIVAALAALHPPHEGYRRLRRRARAIRAAIATAAAQPLEAAPARVGGETARIPAPAPVPHLDQAADLARIELNLERWRWLPRELGTHHVWVNVPAFDLAVREGSHGRYRDRLRMPATVGQTDAHWQTPVLSDRIVAASFFPTWTPTVTIQREEILPQARLDGGARLDSLGFFVERRGRRMDPRDVDWARARAGQYRLVQRGGPLGRLGRIKFVMPNRHFILIHDTTSPDEFDAERRAFSHGCVRAGDVEALADEVLGLANGWAPGRASGMLTGAPRSRSVRLRQRLPVHLVYFTAEVTPDGTLVTHDDLYGFDAPLAEALR